MSPALNEIERSILDYMVSYLRENTYQPSIREIGERFGIKSTKTVSEHLQALAEKGFLERDPSRSRGVKILGMDLSPGAVTVPCLSRLPDDQTGVAPLDAESRMTLDRRLAGVQGSFLVRAHGDDLAAMGVQEGDYILVEPVDVSAVADGDVVVARPGGGAPAYHRITRNGTAIYLQSLRGADRPELVEDPSVAGVTGRVGGIFRRMDHPPAAGSLTAH
jgi:repressor LexA